MTTSADLLDAVFAALTVENATDAGALVFRPGDWPTQGGQYPILKLRVVRESKQSLGRGGPPEFTVITTVRVTGEVSELGAVDDAGAFAAEQSLWRLQRQVEVAVINSYPLTAMISQFVSVDSQLSYNSDAETHLAGIQIDLAMEFYQGPEMFGLIASDDVTDVELTVPTYPPHGLSFDLPA